MSIIGPRPVVEDELVEYGEDIDKFLSVKPGVFGLWQASGRSNIEYPERAQMELDYVDRANLRFDFYILFKTVIAIFKRWCILIFRRENEFSLIDLVKRLLKNSWWILILGIVMGASLYTYAKHSVLTAYTAERYVIVAKATRGLRIQILVCKQIKC